MYTVMIVDDEEPVLESYSYMLKKFGDDFRLGAAVRSGFEALEQVGKVQPDLIFMDIGMPGIDGLETIEEIQSRYPETVCVISTAYERFDIAKRAVPLGVFDYLVKPVSKTRFLTTLDKVRRHFAHREKSYGGHVRALRNGAGAQEWEMKNFLSLLPWKHLKHEEWEGYRTLFQLSSDEGAIVIVRCSANTNEFADQAYDAFVSQLPRYFQLLSTHYMESLVLYVSRNEHAGRLRNVCDSVISSISDEAVREQVKLGVGEFHPFDELYLSFRGAQEQLADHADHLQATQESMMIRELRKLMAVSHEWEVLLREYEKFYSFVFQGITSEVGTAKLLQLFTLLVEDLEQAAGKGIPVHLPFNLAAELCSGKGKDELIGITKGFLLTLYTLNENVHQENRPVPLRRAIALIDSSFASPLQLSSVAGECGVSPAYLSRLFSEHLKMSFIDYLTGVRLSQAEKLLKERSMSVKEISYTCGFNDPNYFSRLFRKKFGVTPSEYVRNRMEKLP